MIETKNPGQWVYYDPMTATYDTRDGTKIPSELCDGADCLADILRIAQIRDKQRDAIAKASGE